jgi:hypothetical protein
LLNVRFELAVIIFADRFSLPWGAGKVKQVLSRPPQGMQLELSSH